MLDKRGLTFRAYGFKEWKRDEGKKFQTGWRYHQGLAASFPSAKRVFRMFKKSID